MNAPTFVAGLLIGGFACIMDTNAGFVIGFAFDDCIFVGTKRPLSKKERYGELQERLPRIVKVSMRESDHFLFLIRQKEPFSKSNFFYRLVRRKRKI